MPEKTTIERARRDAREGKSASTQAGEFVREQIHHIREGKHGARSAKQAIAIGLSEARRSGVKLPPPGKGRTSAETRRKVQRDSAKARSSRIQAPKRTRSSATRANATLKALRKEPRRAASKRALGQQARQAARRRGPADRSRAARKAARTRRKAR